MSTDAEGVDVVMVVHDAARTGPPIFAIGLLRWLREHVTLDLAVVLVTGGPLAEDFAATVPTVRLDQDPDRARTLLATADLVYLNTAASVEALATTGVRPRRVLSHVHELDVALAHYLPAEDRRLLLSVTDRFVVGPACAAANLTRNHGVAPDRIGRVPYFVPPTARAPDRDTARRRLGVAPETVVIGACGTRDWRKAPDLFVQLAWWLRRRSLDRPLHFVWLGGPIPSVDHWDEATDVELLDLDGSVTFLPHQPEPEQVMAAYDIFVLTSREDTFPLVCLHAGALGIPVVCFEGGGIPELLQASGGGRVVPYLDLEALTTAVADLVGDGPGRRAQGQRLAAHLERAHTLEATGPAIVAEMEGLRQR